MFGLIQRHFFEFSKTPETFSQDTRLQDTPKTMHLEVS